MKLRNPRLLRLVAILAAGLIRAWMATIRVRVHCLDRVDHPADADRERFIYAFWHESLLAPVAFRGRARVRVLISRHRDGELIAQVCGHLGVGVVRGSTARGGGAALVELWDCSQTAHLVFTPDGPRGPRRRVQVGMVALASRTGLPIVPVGVGFGRAWRVNSWDRFALPRPFSVVTCVAGESIHVPPELDRDGLESFRACAEERMLAATEAAEQWAHAGGAGTSLRGPHMRRSAAAASKRAGG